MLALSFILNIVLFCVAIAAGAKANALEETNKVLAGILDAFTRIAGAGEKEGGSK